MRGEYESFQIILDNSNGTTALSGSPTVSTAPGFAAEVLRVGYVYCAETPMYSPSGGGWLPDALLAVDTVRVAPGAIQTLYVKVHIAADAAAGRLAGSLSFAGHTVSFAVTVWDLYIPAFSAQEAFNTSYEFSYRNGYLSKFYNGNLTENMKHTYFDFLYSMRFPADKIYLESPRPIEDYKYVAAQGAKWLALLDVSSIPFDHDTDTPLPYTKEGVASARRARAAKRSASPMLANSLQADECANHSAAYVSHMLDLMAPAVVALEAAGIANKTYVYGFDEEPVACEGEIRKLFGAVKARWPWMRTMSVLNWPSMPQDLPVDVWVLQYEDYNASIAEPWVASGNQLWLYHCILPSGPSYLNTFIERPLLQARQLFWLASQLPVSGWLYYADDLWQGAPVPDVWTSYEVNGTARFSTTRTVVRPVSDPGSPVFAPGADDRLLDFDPSLWLWTPSTAKFANGDGSFMYPGAAGPVSTLRLEAQRDGVEDWELLRKIPDAATRNALAASIVQGPTAFVTDPAVLEAARTKAAGLASAV